MSISGYRQTLIWLGLLLAFALIVGGTIAYTVFFTGLVLAALSLVKVWMTAGVTAACRPETEKIQAGNSLNISIEITNQSRLPQPWVQCWLETPPSFGQPDNLACYRLSLRPKETRFISDHFLARTRGIAQWGRMTIRTGDRFGFFTRLVQISDFLEMAVLPETRDVGLHFRPFEESDFSGVRGYGAGDNMSKIHWKASARTGSLLVKEYQSRLVPSVHIVLDLPQGLPADSVAAGTLERAVSLAASLSALAIGRGWAAGLLAFGRERAVITAGSGQAHLNLILLTLAGLQPEPQGVPWTAAADEVKCLRAASQIIFITAGSKRTERTLKLTELLIGSGISYSTLDSDQDFPS